MPNFTILDMSLSAFCNEGMLMTPPTPVDEGDRIELSHDISLILADLEEEKEEEEEEKMQDDSFQLDGDLAFDNSKSSYYILPA